LFLAYLGIRTLKSRPADQSGPVDGAVLAASFATTFFLTITNPMTILSFAAAFASVGVIGEPGQRASGAALWVLGVFSGSMLWWLILTSVTARFRGFLTPGRLLWLHRLAGIMLLGFGLAALVMGSGTLG
jgi:threonine/homoserine/homoserine lactone efflux protein